MLRTCVNSLQLAACCAENAYLSFNFLYILHSSRPIYTFHERYPVVSCLYYTVYTVYLLWTDVRQKYDYMHIIIYV